MLSLRAHALSAVLCLRWCLVLDGFARAQCCLGLAQMGLRPQYGSALEVSMCWNEGLAPQRYDNPANSFAAASRMVCSGLNSFDDLRLTAQSSSWSATTFTECIIWGYLGNDVVCLCFHKVTSRQDSIPAEFSVFLRPSTIEKAA